MRHARSLEKAAPKRAQSKPVLAESPLSSSSRRAQAAKEGCDGTRNAPQGGQTLTSQDGDRDVVSAGYSLREVGKLLGLSRSSSAGSSKPASLHRRAVLAANTVSASTTGPVARGAGIVRGEDSVGADSPLAAPLAGAIAGTGASSRIADRGGRRCRRGERRPGAVRPTTVSMSALQIESPEGGIAFIDAAETADGLSDEQWFEKGVALETSMPKRRAVPIAKRSRKSDAS